MLKKARFTDNSDVLVIGAGYLGTQVARLCQCPETKVYASSRSPSRLQRLSQAGHHPLKFDWTRPDTFGNLPLSRLSASPRVLVAVSYDRTSGIGRYECQVGGLRNLLHVLPPDARICYISTSGVYHQGHGQWVDESSPTRPTRIGGQVHLQAENQLHQVRPRASWAILRLAGIYGPGRVPRVADVIAGRTIQSPENGYLNLIHVADAARAVLAAWQWLAQYADPSVEHQLDPFSGGSLGGSLGGEISAKCFCIADDAPVLRGEFYREIARQCGAPPPSFSPPEDAPASARSTSNKRVWNRKMRHQLLARLRFPDYRSGLADVLDNDLE